ncbi:acetylglutamate kinase [Jeotgalibacillus proteolyticus]|uniref:Acetylglutamate kinase n=1 Tax=Jeotgalibacillus proteolyticus TaxID=2082395 RepID=A0A2S5GA42_9BACL|nr:acetylglutamate kinase [Jeotgalibacillus proteolyticus]PPA69784.1 acetylglutamate kinase [Jeotgalibacillus proteolyticus]
MTTSKSMPAIVPKPITVIKLGGSLLHTLTPSFYTRLSELLANGHSLVIVHGGGPAINKKLAQQKIETPVKNGLRVTSAKAIEVVQTTLIGRVNPSLVHQLNAAGIQAVGLSGFDHHLLLCDYLDKEIYEYVGSIQEVKTELLTTLTHNGYVPVVSCIGTTADGQALNINADTVAGKVAHALDADELLLVTDTPGIKINDQTQKDVSSQDIEQWIQSGDIYGGMIPKSEAALNCLKEGIPSVQIVGESLTGTTISQEVEAHDFPV